MNGTSRISNPTSLQELARQTDNGLQEVSDEAAVGYVGTNVLYGSTRSHFFTDENGLPKIYSPT